MVGGARDLLRLVLALLLAFGLTFAAGSGKAQQDTEVTVSEAALDYEVWESTAKRAEAAVEAGKASDRALEDLRAEIVTWRESFLKAQDASGNRIATLQAQLDVLGPEPETGDESVDIASRRADLNAQLARLQAPVLAAAEAYSRANGVISEIDQIIRERQTEALLDLGPSPLNPLHWNTALTESVEGLVVLGAEVQTNWNTELRQYEFRQNLLVIVPFTLLGLVLLLRGRRWTSRLSAHLMGRVERGKDVLNFVVSLIKVVMPLAGLSLLVAAVHQSGFAGLRAEQLISAIPIWGGVLLVVLWISDRLFPYLPQRAPFDLEERLRPAARRHINLLALALVLGSAIRLFGEVTGLSAEASVVLEFPITVLISAQLTQMARFLLNRVAPPATEDSEQGRYRLSAVRGLAQGALVVGIASPVLSAIGYRAAADAMLYPTVMTIGLLALVLVLQQFIEDLYALAVPRGEERGEALVPVLIGFVLVLAALPLLALVWGARVADLTELWSRFLEGFQVGSTRISPTDFLTFALIFAIGYVVTRVLQGALKGSVLPKTRIDPGGQNAIVAGIGYVGVTVAALIAITAAGIDLSSIAIVAGALSVGIGFGLQNIVSNFVSGIILLIERPITEGDWIEVGGQMGYVRDISVRSTRIETFDRTDVIVPNADLVSGTVTNYTRGNTVGRVILPVGVAYGTDTRKVEAILRELAEAHPMVLINPKPGILFKGFGADSLDFEIRAILRDVNFSLSVKSDLNHEIARKFAEEGIEIPFAQRDIWLRNPEVLRPDAKPDDADDKTEGES
ncbi:putative MscS family protein.1 precursor [Thalassovita gelatinovora]|uniref:Putative MscS family protein.1 n=1 Tax=Thalassovita gelatinovora TaxID=53501 RepID=A0A0P1G4C0_THAGE|nr:DUF3772 domain-containing protein [Thalassovita gelatinovora]QIZ79134.1 mechanosensitive ion channel family protein [Thalassovita gelatinovora]CUH68801.1 putative MscS family protein.1 precursor [Thalassovita gelatinovora]SEQ59014.1 Small-conductance mechanosensitive channel [Thalassovita gelatinovora]